MEREELISQITSQLGSTRLQFSDRTMEAFYDGFYADVKDADTVSDDWLSGKVAMLKALDGQYHNDFSKEVNAWKDKHNGKPAPDKDKDDADNGENNDEIAALRAEIAAFRKERAAEAASRKRGETLSEVESLFKKNLKNKGYAVNAYILKNVMRDFELPELKDGEHHDITGLASEIEKSYSKSLKEAGLSGNQQPGFNTGSGGKGSAALDRYFERKKSKRQNSD